MDKRREALADIAQPYDGEVDVARGGVGSPLENPGSQCRGTGTRDHPTPKEGSDSPLSRFPVRDIDRTMGPLVGVEGFAKLKKTEA